MNGTNYNLNYFLLEDFFKLHQLHAFVTDYIICVSVCLEQKEYKFGKWRCTYRKCRDLTVTIGRENFFADFHSLILTSSVKSDVIS